MRYGMQYKMGYALNGELNGYGYREWGTTEGGIITCTHTRQVSCC